MPAVSYILLQDTPHFFSTDQPPEGAAFRFGAFILQKPLGIMKMMGTKDNNKKIDCRRMAAKEAMEKLGSGPGGLTMAEAKKRLKIYGYNEVKTNRENPGQIFARQLRSSFFYLLIIAAAVAFSVGERLSALMVLVFLSINTGLAFYQEWRAAKAVQALERHLVSRARVLRQGRFYGLDKREIVAGDIVSVRAGDSAPADLKVLSAANLCVDESLVTGESAPVQKTSAPGDAGADNMFAARDVIPAGARIVAGRALGLAVATGSDTVAGRALALAAQTARHSAYERNLAHFADFIYKSALILIVLTFVARIWLRGTANFYDYLIFCIALAVGLIPEALPVVVAFGLSQGALRLSRDHVVVKRLSAIEDLGDVNVICVDKTGTLTKNKITLEKIFAGDPEKCLALALACGRPRPESEEEYSSPFDKALFGKAPPAGHARRAGSYPCPLRQILAGN